MKPFQHPEDDREITKRNQAYGEYVSKTMPKSKTLLGCIKAFIVGGIICCIGQSISLACQTWFHMESKLASNLASIILVFLGAMLTGIGVYDDIGKFAGGGSIIPITGFANSIVSPAMEHKREGLILGVGANLFKISGPVLVNGITASVIYGIFLWIFG